MESFKTHCRLRFERMGNGSVWVKNADDVGEYYIILAEQWSVIVASMSAEANKEFAYELAERFHAGQINDWY